jgi:hypothetical protein
MIVFFVFLWLMTTWWQGVGEVEKARRINLEIIDQLANNLAEMVDWIEEVLTIESQDHTYLTDRQHRELLRLRQNGRNALISAKPYQSLVTKNVKGLDDSRIFKIRSRLDSALHKTQQWVSANPEISDPKNCHILVTRGSKVDLVA